MGAQESGNTRIQALTGSIKQNDELANRGQSEVGGISGAIAGDGGYQIHNRGTAVIQGIITSSEKAEAEGKNHFSTDRLVREEIHNYSNYKGKSIALGVSAVLGGKTLGQEQDERFINVGDSGVSKTFGIGHTHKHKEGLTVGSINTANLTIHDDAGQRQLTGESAAEAAKNANRGITLENNKARSGAASVGFDADKVTRDITSTAQVMQEFDQTRQEIKAHQPAKADEYFAEAQQKRRQNDGYETKETFELEGKAHRISQNASYLDTALGALWGGTLPLASAQIALQHADYAKNAAGHITAGQLYRIDCSDPAAQYYCKDGVGDESVKAHITGNKEDKTEDKRFPWSRDKRVAWDGSAQEIYLDDAKSLARLEADGKKIVRSNPGIYNSKEDAFRNAVKQNPEAARKGNLYVVVNNPTYEVIPGLSEVAFYAAYDKLNDKMGGVMPLTKAEKTNVFLNQYAKNHGIKMESSNHSRGGVTENVSLQYTNNRLGITGIPLEKVRFYGTATNVADYISQTEKNGYVDEDGIQTTVSSAVHKADFVARPLFLLGGNPPTAGNCLFCYAHSSYYAEVPSEYFINKYGEYAKDDSGNRIKNPEYDKYIEKWGKPEKIDGKLFNDSAPKIVIYDNNNKAHYVDYLGREIIQDKSGRSAPHHHNVQTINGKRYIEYEGKKYHADVY